MITYITLSFLLMLSVVKSDEDLEIMCANDFRHMNNTPFDVSKFCSENTCIEKCCGEGEILMPSGHCTNTVKMFQRFKRLSKLLVISDVDYTKIVLFSWDGSVKNKSEKEFVFVQNQRNKNCTSEHSMTNDFFILEDGAVRMQDTGGSNSWSIIRSLEYCLDFKLTIINKKPQVKLVVKEYNSAPADAYQKSLLVLVGSLISSFFLLLVLVVYFLLPKLQNLIGLVLMAYTSTMLVTFLVKIFIQLTSESLTTKLCKIISPVIYFAAISSFFWLNVMSYDVWWSLRGQRKRCVINRRGERLKFMWYCLYAWGIPLLITAIVVTLDNIDLSNLQITKPPFSDCFVLGESVPYYFTIPIGVIIFINIILLSLTVYNIRINNKCQGSRSSSQDTNRFTTYLKLSVLMGVSWCLELIPPDMPLWVFILITTYNVLIGVAIFFLFVFNKRIYLELCKRFNIKKKFTRSFELSSQGTRSGTAGTAKVSTKDQVQEIEVLKSDQKGENYFC